jgi:hypothetical protein
LQAALIRNFYYEGWTLKGKPYKERRKEGDFTTTAKVIYRSWVEVRTPTDLTAWQQQLLKEFVKLEAERKTAVL